MYRRPMYRFLVSIAALHLVLALQAQRVGLVLSGGGAVGLTHIGVIKALEENGIPIDYITGSSMGALVGAMYAAGYSPAQMDSLFQTELYQRMARGEVEDDQVYYFKQDQPDASLFDVKFNVDTTLQTSLPTNLRSPVLTDWVQMVNFSRASAACNGNLDSLLVPFRCVASDITVQEPVIFAQGDLALAVRASMSYPFYFKPIRVNGHLMMDGGMYNNFPSDVMYDSFMPDFIIGSNVAFNSAPPSEDDLMSQLRAMMVEKTNYSVPCAPNAGLIIQPRTATTLFDFSTAKQAVQDGYDAAMARMPEIKAQIQRRVLKAEVEARRKAFIAKFPEMVIGSLSWKGLSPSQERYCENVLNKSHEPVHAADLEPRYFRLYADHSISGLFPKATYVPERGNFDLEVLVKRSKQLDVRVGGLLSSRPVNTGMVGLRYHFFGRVSTQIEATSYFGKYYAAGQLKVHTDLSSRLPLYVEPVFTLHRWDWFSGFATFFDEVKPSYIVNREEWTGVNVGLGLGNKGLLRADLKYVHSHDEYYQTADFGSKDTADATEFYHATAGLHIERNSLNRKQHANGGDRLFGEVRYLGGDEVTVPGTTFFDRQKRQQHHDWFMLKAGLEKYFLPHGHVRFGIMGEGVYSTQSFFQNYTESLIRAPVFQPTPESRTYFISNFRATQYLAGGARAIIAVAKNKFDLRIEGYVFQPYKPILRSNTDEATEGSAISQRSYLASGSLIWQTPLGPLWFNTSYIDGLEKPWQVSLNFGYVIFAQKAIE